MKCKNRFAEIICITKKTYKSLHIHFALQKKPAKIHWLRGSYETPIS